jgi:hypothetical protein
MALRLILPRLSSGKRRSRTEGKNLQLSIGMILHSLGDGQHRYLGAQVRAGYLGEPLHAKTAHPTDDQVAARYGLGQVGDVISSICGGTSRCSVG